MKFTLTKEQKIGAFALVTLIAAYFVINFLKGQDFFNKNSTYFVVYENVEGLTPTGPVFIKGLKAGTVQTIDYNAAKGTFLAKFKIKSKFPIPRNSVAMIYSADLLGSKAVKIVLGDDPVMLEGRDTLQSGIEEGLVEKLVSEFLPLKDSAQMLISSLNKTFVNVNDVLDSNAKRNIAQTLVNLNKTIKNAEAITRNLDSNGPEITSTLENLKALSAKLDQAAAPLAKTVNNLAQLTDTLKEANLAQTIKSLKTLLTDIQDPKGSIGRLLATDSLHNSINTLVMDLDKLIENINKDPKKYIKISVF